MSEVNRGRYTADIEGDFVVFLIGMHINRPWRIRTWWPVFRSMFGMVRELRAHPEKGALCSYFALISGVGPAVIQYWRSFEQLEAFARNTDDPHLKSWRRYNQAVLDSGDVGIWHETYQVAAGQYESVYANMGRIGLARAGALKPVGAKGHSAARRLGRVDRDDLPAGTCPRGVPASPDGTAGRAGGAPGSGGGPDRKADEG